MMNQQSQKPKKRLFRKIGQLASTGTNSGSSVLPTDQVTQSSSVLLRLCKQINLNIFKDCLCNNNLIRLIVKGDPSQDELINTWNDIVFEFSTLVKTDDSTYLFDLQKLIAETEAHLNYVDTALIYLRQRFNQKYIDKLIEMGYDGFYPSDDHVQYLKQLDRIKSLAKSRVMDLEDYRAELKRYQQQQGETPKQKTEDEFDEELALFSRFQGYRIDPEKTMVTEYAGIINGYIKDIKRQFKKEEVNHG